MTRDEEIQRDLGIKLSTAIGEVLEREMRLIQQVLPPTRIAKLLLATATGLSASALSIILQMRKDERDPSEAFDVLAAALHVQLSDHKPAVMDGIALIDAGQGDEAVRRYGSGRRR
ncbi:hypothetical protein [uncultured Sphingomonas sp.]|uniref:hypothetical protein n=1 Tax=uncultured Sphingomonas sp. TaxID=158754 RepID=UPI0025E90F24|nr:hypothetical protein [uncultured Sphingomonas sp.]